MKSQIELPIDSPRLPALAPEAVRQRLGNLIRHYARTRSPAIARSVVRHIDALCSHPELECDATERCAYLRLRTHWRWLAQVEPVRQGA
jgi:hypothetical protein